MDDMNTVMPVGPMNGNNNGFGFGDGSWWVILLFILLLGGNGFNGNNQLFPWMNQSNQMQEGFQNQMLNTQIMGLQQGVTSGFGDVQNSLCNGFNQAEIAASNRQIANMQQAFNSQTAIENRLDTIAANQQTCCCENRAAVADLKYTMATEAAATRAAGQANTQSVLDKLCQLELDGVKQNYENQLRDMQNQLNAAQNDIQSLRFAASQGAQTNALERFFSNSNFTGCGCSA